MERARRGFSPVKTHRFPVNAIRDPPVPVIRHGSLEFSFFPRVITLERSLREDCRGNVEISVKFRKGRDPWWYESLCPRDKRMQKKKKGEKRKKEALDAMIFAGPGRKYLRCGVVASRGNNKGK